MLKPREGSVLLDGTEISSLPTKQVARRLGLLPQSSIAPDGISVAELVARGRHPHQRLLRQWSQADERAVRDAMADTRVEELAERLVDELSGGQRQRVWLAMALAQETPLLLLDEPTTFLDIAHQMEVLDLCAELHAQGRTLVAVLHDLNHACRYATHLIAMREGAIVAQGDPREIVDAELVESVFGLPCHVVPAPRPARRWSCRPRAAGGERRRSAAGDAARPPRRRGGRGGAARRAPGLRGARPGLRRRDRRRGDRAVGREARSPCGSGCSPCSSCSWPPRTATARGSAWRRRSARPTTCGCGSWSACSTRAGAARAGGCRASSSAWRAPTSTPRPGSCAPSRSAWASRWRCAPAPPCCC